MLKVTPIKTFLRKFSSALYITGDKAKTHYVVLTPHIDFEEQIQNKAELKQNISARKLEINLDRVEKRWNFYKTIDDHKFILEATRSEISAQINKLKEDPENNKDEIEKLVLHAKLVRDDLKNVKDFSYGVEESANVGVLGLPNVLHLKTPIDSEVIIHQHLDKPNQTSSSHISIAETSNLLEYHNPIFYFLKSDAALFEFALSNYFQKQFLNLKFTQFSNADFVRSIVVEGCGTDYLNQSKAFTLFDPNSKDDEISKLHLVGGASLYAFMAYFARHLLSVHNFPLQLFTLGRNYNPINTNCKPSLFNVAQESVISFFTAIQDDSEVLDSFLDNLIKQVVNMYEPLGYHFRIMYTPADKLQKSESLRVSIQMFSNHLQDYVEVGNLSVYDNYLSKRLLFTYKDNNMRKFPKIIAGNILSIQKFLGCVIENNSQSNKPLLSNILQENLC